MDIPSKDYLLRLVRGHRDQWASSPKPATIETPGPGQESVWDFPRPPRLETVAAPLKVVHAGETVAQTARGLRIVETAGAPVYFFPPEDVRLDWMSETGPVTVCEWKGAAIHYTLTVKGRSVTQAAFCYPDPLDDLGEDYARVAGWPAFYPSRVEACFVGEEQVRPQPGGYYAGWVTNALAGPIKGAPGSEGW